MNARQGIYATRPICWLNQLDDLPEEASDFDFVDTGYLILDSDPSLELCNLMVTNDPPSLTVGLLNAWFQLVVAYAKFRLGKFDDSLRVLLRVISWVEKKDIDWLYKRCETDIIAAVVYSYCLNKSEELQDFYDEMFEYHREQDFSLYHNLAVGLFFAKDYSKAKEMANQALKDDPDEKMTQMLIRLCDQACDQALSGRPSPSLGTVTFGGKTYTKEELHIFYVEA